MSSVAAMDAAKKKSNLSLAIDCNVNKPDPTAKIDCCVDIEGKMSSLEDRKKMMKAVEVDIKKMAEEAKQLRWDDAKMMLENLWKYNMLGVDESAGAVITATQHHH